MLFHVLPSMLFAVDDLPPLTSRQERRRQPSHPTPRTIDSWDFSHTPQPSVVGKSMSGGNSPTTSVIRACKGVKEEWPEELEENLNRENDELGEWVESDEEEDIEDGCEVGRGLIGDSSDSSAVSEESSTPASGTSPTSSMSEENEHFQRFLSKGLMDGNGAVEGGAMEDLESTLTRSAANRFPIPFNPGCRPSQLTAAISSPSSSQSTKSPRFAALSSQPLPVPVKSPAMSNNSLSEALSPPSSSSTLLSRSAPHASTLTSTSETSVWRKLTSNNNDSEKVGKRKSTIGNLFSRGIGHMKAM
jgi:hypothetical protein